MTASQRSARVSVLAMLRSQQPACAKLKPVPTSAPGCVFQLDPSCGSGPNTSFDAVPAASLAAIRKSPDPVIRQTTLMSWPAAGGTEWKKRAQTLPLVESKPASGCPPVKVALGVQAGRPTLPRPTPVAGFEGA